MEFEGLKRAIAFLEGHVHIKDLVTDRHSMVKKFIREQHPDKNHNFDVCHVVKGNYKLKMEFLCVFGPFNFKFLATDKR